MTQGTEPGIESEDLLLQEFREACLHHGLKVTHQRLEIYRVVASSNAHPDAETVFRQVRKRIPTISLDTVYRGLKLLADHRIISVVGVSHERVRFDANVHSHHHFVCTKCGAIMDFNAPELGEIAPPAEACQLGRPVSIQLEVKGVCAKCQELERRS